MLSEPRRLIITILTGNELDNVAASVISAAVIIHLLGAENKWINIFVMVPVLLLVGEITPKTLAIRNNVAFASVACQPVQLSARIEIDVLEEALDIELPEGNYVTLAGFLLGKAREVPAVGSVIEVDDLIFIVERATPQAIQEVRIRLS